MVQSNSIVPPRPAARLVLADGSVFHGVGFGAVGRGIVATGEVVFNTAHSGYQESLTDPSYAGQILVQTFPLIGNTGVNAEDVESPRVQAAAFVVRELARRHSNWRATRCLDEELRAQGVLGLTEIDTRALVRRIRERGAMPGVATDRSDLTDAELVELAREAPGMEGRDLVTGGISGGVSGCGSGDACRDRLGAWREPLGEWAPAGQGLPREGVPAGHSGSGDPAGPLRVLALDCGAKHNILRHLVERGCEVERVSPEMDGRALRDLIVSGRFDGLFISNGPGDPAAVQGTVRALREVVFGEGPPLPTFGICLGHQLLALAAGARTYKLAFGHRGANQPVRDVERDRVRITSQNHGFAVERESLERAGGRVTHVHLNDGTVAGFSVDSRLVWAVQYHPEASPGPHDAAELFDRFVSAMRLNRSRLQNEGNLGREVSRTV